MVYAESTLHFTLVDDDCTRDHIPLVMHFVRLECVFGAKHLEKVLSVKLMRGKIEVETPPIFFCGQLSRWKNSDFARIMDDQTLAGQL